MGLPKRLTEMQMRFAEFIVFGGPEGPVSQMEAAKLAGYSHNRARQEGSELMNPRLSPLVAKFVGELKEERLKKFEVNYETHIAELDRIKQMALKKGSFSSNCFFKSISPLSSLMLAIIQTPSITSLLYVFLML